MPILLNRLYPSREAALGDIDLVARAACGFAWNRTFDPGLIVYDGAYENDQSHSPTFLSHLEERASDILRLITSGEHYLEKSVPARASSSRFLPIRRRPAKICGRL